MREDFPFATGTASALGARDGVVVLAACALGFLALLALPRMFPGPLGSWVAASAFVIVQLAGLAVAVGPAWKTIFRRPSLRDVAIALAGVPFVMAVPAAMALAVVGSSNLAANSTLQAVQTMPSSAVANLLGSSAIQLLGEELLTILPFLAFLAALRRSGIARRPSIAIAWVASSLLFGALHLPTYDWHLGQAFLVIGSARLVLTGVYVLTRNLWASTITHVINDWLAMVILAAA